MLRCTVGIRCFTVSVYFLLQINFFKSTFDLFFWLIWPFAILWKFWYQFLVLTYATVNLNSFRNMFALFRHGFNLVLPFNFFLQRCNWKWSSLQPTISLIFLINIPWKYFHITLWLNYAILNHVFKAYGITHRHSWWNCSGRC